jgi:hypothetical protein
VEQRGGDRLLVLAEIREDLRGTPRMPDERFARAALLPVVGLGGEAKRSREQVPIDVRVVGLDVRDQLVEQLLVLFARFEDGHRKSVLPGFPLPCLAARLEGGPLKPD